MKCKLFALLLLTTTIISADAITIGQWTFESGTAGNPPSANGTEITGIASATGGGTASGHHASSSTVWDNPVGNGSSESLNANRWAIGDYFQLQVSTLGLENIVAGWDQTGSSAGPRDFVLKYSTDGLSFTTFQTYTVLENSTANGGTWTSSTIRPNYHLEMDLGSITALDNIAAVFFRLEDVSTVSTSGGAVAWNGYSRIDNFTVSGTEISAVPDNGSTATLLIIPLLIFLATRRFSSAPIRIALLLERCSGADSRERV